jgi:hypothetical protein
VHQPGEGENQEDRQAEEEVQLEDRVRPRDVAGGGEVEGEDALRPGHEGHHLVAVQVAQRNRNGGEAERQLQPQQQDDGVVAEAGRRPDTGVEEAAVRQHGRADDGKTAGQAADHDGQDLLEGVADAD